MAENKRGKSKIATGLLLLLGILFATAVNASMMRIGSLQGNTRITGPAIWYNETGTPGVNTSFSLYRQKANVTGTDYNLALHVYDHSDTEGIIVYKDWYINTGEGERLKIARANITFYGVNITSDPNNMGLVVTEIELSGEYNGQSCIAFFSFYYYKNNILVPSYEVADTTSGYSVIDTGEGGHIRINGWDKHIAYIRLSYTRNNKVTVTWKLDGETVYRMKNYNIGGLCSALKKNHVSYVSFNTGLYDPGTKYDLFIDNVSLRVRTTKTTYNLNEKFTDGVDNHLERTYTIQNGSNIITVDEPPDTRVGSYIEYAVSEPVLAVETSINNGGLLQSRLKLSDGYCYSGYNTYSTPIEVENIEDTNLDSITVLINLSSSNFNDWSKLSSSGSDIYVTDASGYPLYYWIEYLNKTRERALILVNVTNLPKYSRKTIYLHYGGFNPYASYRDPDKVYEFYDDFNYTSLSGMTSSGKWQAVNSSAVMNVSNSNIYITTDNNIYAVRTAKQFGEPLTIDYSLWACKNNSVDWDAGIALGSSESGTVMFVDDMNVPGGSSQGYSPDYMAIAPYNWNPSSAIDQLPDTDARRDMNWLIPHIYRVDINSNLYVWFNDTTDGRWNNNESLNDIKSNVLPGYIWLMNDGDNDNNCAIYGWIGVLPYSVSSQSIYRVHVMEEAEPLLLEYLENATNTKWNTKPVYAFGYTNLPGLESDLIDLIVDNNVLPGNLSEIFVFTSQPAGAATSCILDTVNSYYLNPSAITPLIVFLEDEINMSTSN
ncbi:MAG: DUF2341 domain-containing protein [Desulfurococcales archaeon]|nr:DUF2341 domain-containing protein [Desulfurococcales archaeon]